MDTPVFRFQSGKLVHMKIVDKILAQLSSFLGTGPNRFAPHSFRAGLPSFMATHPGDFSYHEIKSVGKWCSDTADRYLRLRGAESREIYRKIGVSMM